MDLELPKPVYTPQPTSQPQATTTNTPTNTNATTGTTNTTGTTPSSIPTTPPTASTPPNPTPVNPYSTASSPPMASASVATPPPPVRKKRVKKPLPPPEDPVVAEFNAFKNRLQLARLRGEEGEKEAERELEQNAENGLHDKNKRAVETGLIEIYDTLFPLGFHSVWLYGLGKKYSGYEFTAKYLQKNKGKNWVLFVPRRQIVLWQECAKDFLTTCNDALTKNEISASDILDIITVYHVDTLERDKFTFLDDQIEKPVIPLVHDVIKMTAESLSEENALKFYTRMLAEHPLIIQQLKPEELRDLLVFFLDNISDENAKALVKEIKNAESVKSMLEVNDQLERGTAITVKPRPPTTPPQQTNAGGSTTGATSTAESTATIPTDNTPPMNPASS
jgi:hypothetical protein